VSARERNVDYIDDIVIIIIIISTSSIVIIVGPIHGFGQTIIKA